MATDQFMGSAFSTFFRLISALLVWVLLLAPVNGQSRREEIRTLLNFKALNRQNLQTGFDASGAVYWNMWKESDENPCAWFGVTCTDNHTVWKLDFSGWGFSGLDVQVLSNLTDLRELDASSNIFFNIPDDIGNLTGLTLLDFSQSRIFQKIRPSISKCRNLRSLSLQENRLDGGISNLRGLVNLQFLNLADNQFSGPFPKVLGELPKLFTLDLSNNLWDGSIPSLPNLTNLIDLNLFNNSFTAFEEPWLLGANSTLQYLSVAFNRLGASIPSSVPNLLSLLVLNMSSNSLSGGIPFGFSEQLKGPFSLDLSQNQLTEMPADLLQQSGKSCPSLNLSHNLLTGTIPIDGANYSCFYTLDFSHNNLSGPLPPNIFGEEGLLLQNLWLQNNSLSGDIVDILLESPGIRDTAELRLQKNLFTGDLSRMIDMRYYQLSTLVVLDLSNNDLRWSVSEAFPDPIQAALETLASGSTGMKEFRVGGNNFLGTSLPATCFVNQSNLLGLLALDLSNNQLKGGISGEAFDSSCVPFLQFLDLSNNDISGPVPESIVTLPALAILDVSNNKLSGPLPSIPLNSTLIKPRFFSGNDGLCGYPLNACPTPGSGLEWWVLLLIIGGSLTGAALLSFVVITWQWRLYSKRHQQDVDLIRTLMERDSATLMSLRELRKATDNFSESAQIGQGGFGTVYVGKLNDGTTVAIKRSKRDGSDKDKEQFLNEVRILSHVNHRNLVKLMGCCMENKIAVLVFEFVSNGTLQEHLQGKMGPARLTWKQRLKIAVQTADALNYLHAAATFPIYHRDVKSANILLNNDLNAKVADFGISKLAPVQATHVSTMAIQGTMGYIDPEYYTSYRLTDKSDVYSFGVVLLELISAKPALDFNRGGDNTSLVNFAGPYIKKGELHDLVDPALTNTYSDPTGHGRVNLECGNAGFEMFGHASQSKTKHERGIERASTLAT